MKTKGLFIVKSVAAVLLFTALLFSIACKSRQEKLHSEKTLAVKKTEKIPGVDIHTAVFMGDLKTIKQHIAAGSDLNVKDAYGSTPLNIAATFGKTEVAILLINAGADVNLKNNDGSTPLHVSAFFGRKEIVRALLENGADKELKNNYGATPIETVLAPFYEVKGIYDQISKDLGPLGLKLDYDYLEKVRLQIADMLR